MESADWAAVKGVEPAAGRLLVATPLLTDAHFRRTVVYLLEHDGGGTVGVILNRPSHTPVGQVLPDWHDAVSGPAVVFGGGPVQPDGALCLGLLDRDTDADDPALIEERPDGQHDADGRHEVVDGVSTVDLDGDVTVIAPLARSLRVFAGHAGWSPGQLEHELDEGAWWVLPGGPDDLFSEQPRRMWAHVLRRQPPPLSLVSTFPPDVSVN
ncbi:YqgE/AlgH family protein [uncultured Jatrophihabitans sp.]|uniref:YqgE/AlgH family protein n=1 Tax=uncultured Jatrophihabitans sp. TaxID=1610747 RepID=UPI0035CB0D33